MEYYIEFNNTKYDCRHGGPFDRGSADSYYGRAKIPHYYVGASVTSDIVDTADMSEEQIMEYNAGYEYNELYGDKKEW